MHCSCSTAPSYGDVSTRKFTIPEEQVLKKKCSGLPSTVNVSEPDLSFSFMSRWFTCDYWRYYYPTLTQVFNASSGYYEAWLCLLFSCFGCWSCWMFLLNHAVLRSCLMAFSPSSTSEISYRFWYRPQVKVLVVLLSIPDGKTRNSRSASTAACSTSDDMDFDWLTVGIRICEI